MLARALVIRQEVTIDRIFAACRWLVSGTTGVTAGPLERRKVRIRCLRARCSMTLDSYVASDTGEPKVARAPAPTAIVDGISAAGTGERLSPSAAIGA